MIIEPDWPTCRDVDCPGVQAKGFDQCLAHLNPHELDQFLSHLGPGTDLDARGTTISEDLITRLTQAVRRKFGDVNFSKARFIGRTVFESVEVKHAVFTGAEFENVEKFGYMTGNGSNWIMRGLIGLFGSLWPTSRCCV